MSSSSSRARAGPAAEAGRCLGPGVERLPGVQGPLPPLAGQQIERLADLEEPPRLVNFSHVGQADGQLHRLGRPDAQAVAVAGRLGGVARLAQVEQEAGQVEFLQEPRPLLGLRPEEGQARERADVVAGAAEGRASSMSVRTAPRGRSEYTWPRRRP